MWTRLKQILFFFLKKKQICFRDLDRVGYNYWVFNRCSYKCSNTRMSVEERRGDSPQTDHWLNSICMQKSLIICYCYKRSDDVQSEKCRVSCPVLTWSLSLITGAWSKLKQNWPAFEPTAVTHKTLEKASFAKKIQQRTRCYGYQLNIPPIFAQEKVKRVPELCIICFHWVFLVFTDSRVKVGGVIVQRIRHLCEPVLHVLLCKQTLLPEAFIQISELMAYIIQMTPRCSFFPPTTLKFNSSLRR